MKAIMLKALPKIEAMSGMASVTGIQINTLTLIIPCVVDQPVEYRTCKPLRCFAGKGCQIIDVKHFSTRKELREPKAGGTLDHAFVPESDYLV